MEPEKVMTTAEWAGLSAESRERINRWEMARADLERVVRLFMEATATSAGDGIALANEEARKLGFQL